MTNNMDWNKVIEFCEGRFLAHARQVDNPRNQMADIDKIKAATYSCILSALRAGLEEQSDDSPN